MGAPKKSEQVLSAHPDLRRVAFHEAGHAVVTYALGLAVHEVTIEPGAEDGIAYAGISRTKMRRRDLLDLIGEAGVGFNDGQELDEHRSLARRVEQMQVAFGGMIAEELFCGGASAAGLEHDDDNIQRLAALVCPFDAQEQKERSLEVPEGATYEDCLRIAEERLATADKTEEEHFVDWVKHRTVKLLRNRRDAVERVAEALLERGTLRGAEVEKLSAVQPARAAHERPGKRPAGLGPG